MELRDLLAYQNSLSAPHTSVSKPDTHQMSPAPSSLAIIGMESRDLLAYLNGLNAGMREITKGENSANYMMEGGCRWGCWGRDDVGVTPGSGAAAVMRGVGWWLSLAHPALCTPPRLPRYQPGLPGGPSRWHPTPPHHTTPHPTTSRHTTPHHTTPHARPPHLT